MADRFNELQLWPTRVQTCEVDQAECSQHNDALIQLVRAGVDLSGGPDQEARLHGMEEIEHASMRWLLSRFKSACQAYLGAPLDMDIAVRGVAIKAGQCINTHTESHESDLMVVYWPGGDPRKVGTPLSQNADRAQSPTFLMEDPSRRLTDLRLPFEIRHSVHICPRPGLLIVGPAHLPHNLWPYLGADPFVHIVAQVHVHWPAGYQERF